MEGGADESGDEEMVLDADSWAQAMLAGVPIASKPARLLGLV
jgi:hypothetical protein